MYALPTLVSLPTLSSIASGTIEWPSLGIVVAWIAVAALVGIALGSLRRSVETPPTVARRNVVHLGAARAVATGERSGHREAA